MELLLFLYFSFFFPFSGQVFASLDSLYRRKYLMDKIISFIVEDSFSHFCNWKSSGFNLNVALLNPKILS